MPIQRGNTDIMKSIQKKAKQVSEARGFSSTPSNVSTAYVEKVAYEAGAFASMNRRNSVHNTPVAHSISIPEKMLVNRLLESVETLSSTKEYFNATSSLFTLYATGSLTDGIMESISKSDLKEIKGIVKEFKSMLDSY